MNCGILGVVEAVLQRIDLYKSNFLSISLHIFTFKRHTDMRVGAFVSWYICDVKNNKLQCQKVFRNFFEIEKVSPKPLPKSFFLALLSNPCTSFQKSTFLSISLHIFTFKRHTDMRIEAFVS